MERSATWIFADVTTYSFYANKLITTGEGGAVTTRSPELRDKLLLFRNLAFDPAPARRFIHTHLAHNYRMSGMQAAMGLAQLENVKAAIEARNRVAAYYLDALGTAAQLSFPKRRKECSPAFWMCALQLADDVEVSIPDLQDRLQKQNIGTRRFFYPLNKQPALRDYHPQFENAFPVAEKLFDRGLYLPSSCNLSWDDVKTISASFLRALQ